MYRSIARTWRSVAGPLRWRLLWAGKTWFTRGSLPAGFLSSHLALIRGSLAPALTWDATKPSRNRQVAWLRIGSLTRSSRLRGGDEVCAAGAS